MYSIYGLSVVLPDEISNGLEPANEKADVIVLQWNLENGNIRDGASWYHQWHMPDGHMCLTAGYKKNGSYALCFIDENLEFEISSDNKTIFYQYIDHSDSEVFRHILFTQVIPLIMNLKGIESIHASSVLSQSGVIAFIGSSGYGKSTLAASLIKDGLTLVSDNVVPLFEENNKIWTSSGPGDIGLWPRVWKFLNPNAVIEDPEEKCRVVLSNKQHSKGNHLLSHIYFLYPDKESTSVQIKSISQQEGLVQLLNSVFRLDLRDKRMLQQQLLLIHKVVQSVKMKKIIYPESIPNPAQLSNAIQADINNNSSELNIETKLLVSCN